MYSLFLGTEIYLSFPNYLSYVPFLAVLFDLTETLTHGYAVVMFPDQLPSKLWLEITSAATIIKFVLIGISLLLTVTSLIRRVMMRKEGKKVKSKNK